MSAPERLRALLAEPGFVVMPAIWDGLSAKLTSQAGYKTAFLSGSCVAASRLGGPDLDLLTATEMQDSLNMTRAAAPDLLILADGDHGYGNAMNTQRTVRAYGRMGAAAVLIEDKITPRALTSDGKPALPRDEVRMKMRRRRGGKRRRHSCDGADRLSSHPRHRRSCRPDRDVCRRRRRYPVRLPADEDEIVAP